MNYVWNAKCIGLMAHCCSKHKANGKHKTAIHAIISRLKTSLKFLIVGSESIKICADFIQILSVQNVFSVRRKKNKWIKCEIIGIRSKFLFRNEVGLLAKSASRLWTLVHNADIRIFTTAAKATEVVKGFYVTLRTTPENTQWYISTNVQKHSLNSDFSKFQK